MQSTPGYERDHRELANRLRSEFGVTKEAT